MAGGKSRPGLFAFLLANRVAKLKASRPHERQGVDSRAGHKHLEVQELAARIRGLLRGWQLAVLHSLDDQTNVACLNG